MRTFTTEQLTSFREQIHALVEELTYLSEDQERMTNAFVPPPVVTAAVAPPPTRFASIASFLGWTRPVTEIAFSVAPVVLPEPEVKKAVGKAPRCVSMVTTDPYTLVRFLTELYDEGILRSPRMKALGELTDSALLFFVQCDRALTNTEQRLVDADVIAKKYLLKNGAISWDRIKNIDSLQHPLLNQKVIQRMFLLGTTIEQELNFISLQKDYEALLGLIYTTELTNHSVRLQTSLPIAEKAANKTDKMVTWLQAAGRDFPLQTTLGKYSFYQQYRVEVGKKGTRKSIVELAQQHRYGYLDSLWGGESTSYTRISTLTDMLDKVQSLITQPSATINFQHFLNELAFGRLFFIEAEASHQKVWGRFFVEHPDFQIDYVKVGENASFKSAFLKSLLSVWLFNKENSSEMSQVFMNNVVAVAPEATITRPTVTWRAIQDQLDAYHRQKSASTFSSSKISRVIAPLQSLVTAHGLSLDEDLKLSDKTALIAVIYERYCSSMLTLTEQPTTKKSNLICSSMINLLYGVVDCDDQLMQLLMQLPSKAELIACVKDYFTLSAQQLLKAVVVDEEEEEKSQDYLEELCADVQRLKADPFGSMAPSTTAPSAMTSNAQSTTGGVVSLQLDPLLLQSLAKSVTFIKK